MSAAVELWEFENNGDLLLHVAGSPTALSVLPADEPGHSFERHADALAEAEAAGFQWPPGSGLPLLSAPASDLESAGCRKLAVHQEVGGVPGVTVIEPGVSLGDLRRSTRDYLGLSSEGLALVLARGGSREVQWNRVLLCGVWCSLDEPATVQYGEGIGVSAAAQKLLPCSWLVYRVPDADWIGAWYDGREWHPAELEHVKKAVQRPQMKERRSRQEGEEAFRAAWARGFYAGVPEEARGTCEQAWVDGWQAARGFSS